MQVKRIAANSCDAKLERSFIAISRCQAAQQKAEKRLGGVPRKGVRLSEASAYCEQHPLYGVFYKEIINKVIQCRSKPIQVNPTPKLIEAAPLEIYLVNKFNIAFSVKQ